MAAQYVERGVPLLIVCVATAFIFFKVNEKQNVPYMDEIFHIPQAQNYCHGNFNHWNNKITTLPGLYLLSQIVLQLLSLFSGKHLEDSCSTLELRSVNILLSFIYFLVVHNILQKYHHVKQDGAPANQHKIYLKSLILTSFPLMYFYSFLYYTDVGSTAFVLLGYYLSLLECDALSALSGVVAVIFRQTNIVWVGFTVATRVISHLDQKNVFQNDNTIIQDIFSAVKGCFIHVIDIIKIVLPYSFVLVGFIVFVIKNDGIVVGDRSSHEATLNIPQILYFSVFLMFFSSFILVRLFKPQVINEELKTLSFVKLAHVAIILVLMFTAVNSFTYVHRYLLADNRHYTFYIWMRIFQRHWLVKYSLIPVYLICWLSIVKTLMTKCRPVWILVYVLCTAAVLVPQKLLELRYFVIPYVLFNLHIKMSSYLELVVEFLVYTLVNAVTFYLFLYRPFKWPHDEAVQRFMW